MKKRTLQTLQDLAEIHRLLQACHTRLEQIPRRFKDRYIDIPPLLLQSLSSARCSLEDGALVIAEMENLPLTAADLSRYQTVDRQEKRRLQNKISS